MKIKQEFINSTPEEIWAFLISHIEKRGNFYSIGEKRIRYDANIENDGESIHFIGGKGEERGKEGHSIQKSDFIPTYEMAKTLPYINTNTMKACEAVRGITSPLVGLLYYAGITFHPILYKYLDCDGAIAMLETQNIRFTQATSLNDPFDCHHELFDLKNFEKDIADIFKSMQKQVGVCCLSENYRQMLMWSYYNKHEGICIGLNMQNVMLKISKYGYFDLQSVNYISKYKPKHSELKMDDLKYLVTTKSPAWDHEEEVRLIKSINNKCNESNECNMCVACGHEGGREFPIHHKLTKKCFDSLYFGFKVPDEKKQKIAAMARKKFPKMKIYEMKIEDGALRLKRKLYEIKSRLH